MTDSSDYLLGALGLAAIAITLGFAATRIRARVLPESEGAPARLAESILALGLLVLILEALGSAALLTGPAIVIACAVVGLLGVVVGNGQAVAGGAGPALYGPTSAEATEVAGAHRRAGHAPPDAAPPPAAALPRNLSIALALIVTFLLFAQWTMPTLTSLDRGIYGGDSLWYHLPFAAAFAESGSITPLHFTDPLYLNWFYPQNSELIGAAGIELFGNDFLSPLINLGWLGLALLAAWCIGRPYGAGAISITAVAILLAADLMFSRQPGNANNDITGLALFISSIAILLNARGGGSTPAAGLAIAGLAAGLALGTKLTYVVPVATLTVGVLVIAGSGNRARAAAAWLVPLALGGGYWYVRNLIVAGNPLPWVKLGVGPLALPRSEELEGRDSFSIVDYATDTSVWSNYFFPGLNERFGELWPAVAALAVIALLLVLLRGDRMQRMLAVVAVVTAVAYAFTPLSASGAEGMPLGFRLNLRYLAPALAIGLALLAAPALRIPRRERASGLAVLGLLVVVLLAGHSPLAALGDGYLGGALLIALASAAAIAIALLGARGAPKGALAVATAVIAALLVAFGWPEQRDYNSRRYALDAPRYPRDEHPGTELANGLGAAYQWARAIDHEPIGLGGTTGAFFQYGFYGPDSSNRVRYVGERGTRGSFDEIADCPTWRRALNEGGYRFVVTTPGYDQDNPEVPIPAPFTDWTASDSAATPVVSEALVSVFQIDGELDPAGCPPA